MSEISETEIKAMTKEECYMRGYADGKKDAEQKTGWIPVRERKPPKLEDVLVTDGYYVFVAWYGGEWHTRDSEYTQDLYNIEAWQPLPQPYRDEE